MIYSINNNEITVFDTRDFNPEHILECGQTFRYQKTPSGYNIFSEKLKCILIYDNSRVIINTNNAEYFVNYFDLNRDYGDIKQQLLGNRLIQPSLEFGSGIRILRQNPAEMVTSFIISANNNIPRIRKTIERLCEAFGEQCDGYYAFPTQETLAGATESALQATGVGYRAPYIIDTAKAIQDGFLLGLEDMDVQTARQRLMSLKGIGQKVADCVLLFGYHREDVFPTDVWISRIYPIYFPNGTARNRMQMSAEFTKLFGNLSGYAQQYIFYHARNKAK